MTSFLEEHYERYRNQGGKHALYVVENDIPREEARRLRENYESSHLPVAEEKIREFEEKTIKERREKLHLLEMLDDLEWLTGTGRYGQ